MQRYEIKYTNREPGGPYEYQIGNTVDGKIIASAGDNLSAIIVADALNKIGKYERALNHIARTTSSNDSSEHTALVYLARLALREDV